MLSEERAAPQRGPFAVEASLHQVASPAYITLPRVVNLSPAPLFVLVRRGARTSHSPLPAVRDPRPGAHLPNTGSRTLDSVLQRRHLHRRQRRLKPFVPHLQPSPINRLLQSLASQNAEGMRNSRLLRRLPDPPSDLIDDHVIMRRIPAQQTSDANNGIILPSQSQGPRRQRNLKCPRHPRNINVFLRSASPQQPVASTQQKPLRDKRIKPRHHDGKPPPSSVQLPLQGRKHRLRHRLHLEFDFLCDLRVLCGEFV